MDLSLTSPFPKDSSGCIRGVASVSRFFEKPNHTAEISESSPPNAQLQEPVDKPNGYDFETPDFRQKASSARANSRCSRNRPGTYFSLLGGTSPFSRIYRASVAYCSVSCVTVAHAIPSRERFAGPA